VIDVLDVEELKLIKNTISKINLELSTNNNLCTNPSDFLETSLRISSKLSVKRKY